MFDEKLITLSDFKNEFTKFTPTAVDVYGDAP
jgi:hypothetical protein